MDILVWIIFGAIVGAIADFVMSSDHSMLEDIFLGIIGAFLGGFVFNSFGQPGVTGFNIYSLIVAVIGASVLIFIGRIIRK